MDVRELTIPGAWVITPQQIRDDRGAFLEWFKDPAFVDAVGHPLRLAQANLSVSAAGVLRGIHFADVPPGQAKYVTCTVGAVFDVVIDVRMGSDTFGTWDSVLLDDVDRRAVYLAEGLGHAFLSLDDASAVVYMCSEGFRPQRERAVNALDPDLAITWPTENRGGMPLHHRLSKKDQAAPGLAEARAQGILPSVEDVDDYVASLKG